MQRINTHHLSSAQLCSRCRCSSSGRMPSDLRFLRSSPSYSACGRPLQDAGKKKVAAVRVELMHVGYLFEFCLNLRCIRNQRITLFNGLTEQDAFGFALSQDGLKYSQQGLGQLLLQVVLRVNWNVVLQHIDGVLRQTRALTSTGWM